MGATVSMTMTKQGDKKTTHLVSARSDTGKVHQALKLDIKIVTEHWLWKCFEAWEKMPTEVREVILGVELGGCTAFYFDQNDLC